MTRDARGCIVFSHANSFPAGTYRRLFDTWRAAGYQVHAVEKYGHDPRYPISNHWPKLRDQLIHFAESAAQDQDLPAYLVGHSLGGYLSLLAAAKRPGLARGVVLLDSPIIGGMLTPFISFAKATGLGARFSPSHISKRRRQHWPSLDAARTHFSSKPAFAAWHPQVLDDYLACGFSPAESPQPRGQTLAFTRDVESAIYDTLPHDISGFLRRHPLRCPLAFIGGSRSSEVRQVGMQVTQRLTQGRVRWLDGTHLFPFERPDETASEVLHWLETFSRQPPRPGRPQKEASGHAAS